MCSMLEKFEMMNLLFGKLCLVVLVVDTYNSERDEFVE